jgi:prophage regulatory protein
MPNDRFLTAAQLCQRYGVARSTIYDWINGGILPAPHKFTDQAARWWLPELEAREQEIGKARPERTLTPSLSLVCSGV